MRFVLLLGVLLSAPRVLSSDAINFSADKYRTNLSTGVTEASGNVTVRLDKSTLTSDEIVFDSRKELLTSSGSVKIRGESFTIEGSRAEIQTGSEEGRYFEAMLRTDSGLVVSGSQINALGDSRFRIENGKISYCQDCPQAWSVFGASIELQIEEYAEIHHAMFQVVDQPIAYFPTFYFPIKTKRQSGFLFPKYFFSPEIGSQLSLPYFWTVAPDQDATLEYRYMTKGGQMLNLEHRYLHSDKSFLFSNLSFNRNGTVQNVDDNRYGLSVQQRWQLAPNWIQRFEGELASDTRYASTFEEDFNQFRLPTLANRFSIAYQDLGHVFWLQGIGHQNNLIRSTAFENSPALHLLPELNWSFPSQSIGKLRYGTTMTRMSFRRNADPLDAGTGWIREGDRSSFTLRGFLPYYLFNVLLLESTVETRADYYQFPSVVGQRDAYRARVVFEEKLGAELSNVSRVDLGDLKAIRHTVEPRVSWGYSPDDWRNDHPFFSQAAEVDGNLISSPRFDVFDPRNVDETVELSTAATERRLVSHHLLSWSLGTRLIGRFENSLGDRDYAQLLGASISQDYDLLNNEAKSYIISAIGSYKGISLSTQMAINPNTGDANFRNRFRMKRSKYTFQLSQSIRQDLEQYAGLLDVRLGSWRASYSGVLDALGGDVIEENYLLRYESSASECWFMSLSVQRRPNPDNPDRDLFRYAPRIGFVYKELDI